MRQIKFTRFGASSSFGSFAPGDTARCSVELARHFVEDVRCAVYLDESVAPSDPQKQPLMRTQQKRPPLQTSQEKPEIRGDRRGKSR